MKILITILILIFVQLSIFAQNDHSIFIIYTIKSNVPMKYIRMGLYSIKFKHNGFQIPTSGRFFYDISFNSGLTNEIKLELIDSNCSIAMCDTIPIKIRYSGIFDSYKTFEHFGNISDTLFRSYGQDTIYKDLNINFADEQIQKYTDEYLKHGDY